MQGANAKSKSRKWLMYAAGAGVLFALIFLLRKGTPAAETSSGGTLTTQEGAVPAGGEALAATPGGVTDTIPPPTLNLGGALNPGESVSAREVTSGGEVEAARAREASEAAGATPDQVKTAEDAAYHRGVAKVQAQNKAKAAAAKAKAPAASHATKGHPAAKPKHGHGGGTKPQPAAKHKPKAATKAPAKSQGSRTHKAAPKPHKTTKRR